MPFAFVASDAIVIAFITVVIGGALGLLDKILTRHADRAKSQVTEANATVDVANKALEGMEHLATQLRADNDALRGEDERKAKRVDVLEHELLEAVMVEIKRHGDGFYWTLFDDDGLRLATAHRDYPTLEKCRDQVAVLFPRAAVTVTDTTGDTP